jgi:hypothetical protein
MTSWVETTCPPGWGVDQDCLGMWFAWSMDRDYGGAKDWEGVTVFVDTEAAARRLAWERWALEVLGDRVEWVYRYPSARAAISNVAGEVYLDEESHAPRWWVYMLEGDGVMCGDPVEALARLAALTLAVLGPEVAP